MVNSTKKNKSKEFTLSNESENHLKKISGDYVKESRKRIAETLAGKRLATKIAEDPETLRAERRKTLRAYRDA